MKTLLLSSSFTEDNNKLAQTAINHGWEIVRLEDWRLSTQYQDPIFFGEEKLCRLVASQLGTKLWDGWAEWLVGLPLHFLGRFVEIVPVNKARTLLPKFVKPIANKNFPAKIHKTLPSRLYEEEKVLVSDIVSFDLEVRVFIKENQIKTFSAYRGHFAERFGHGELSIEESKGLWEFVDGVIAYGVPEVMVLDLGRIPGYGWAVMGAKDVHSAELYDCDSWEVLSLL